MTPGHGGIRLQGDRVKESVAGESWTLGWAMRRNSWVSTAMRTTISASKRRDLTCGDRPRPEPKEEVVFPAIDQAYRHPLLNPTTQQLILINTGRVTPHMPNSNPDPPESDSYCPNPPDRRTGETCALEGPGIFNAFSTGTFPIPSRIIPYPQFQQPLPFLLLVLITCV